MFHVNNKKGQVMQVLLFMGIIILLAMTAVFTYYIIDRFYNEFDDLGVTTPEMAQAESIMRSQVASVDYAIVFLLVALIGGLIITSFLIPSHPIFMVINVIGIFVLIFAGMIMSQVYGEVAYGETGVDLNISGAADTFKYSSFLVNYLPFLGAIILGLVTLVMYARGSGGGAY